MPQLDINELTQAEELFNAGKLDEALELLKDLNQLEGLDLQRKSYYQTLKAYILIYQGKYEELIKLGEEMLEESQKLNDKLLSVDGLTLLSFGLSGAENFDRALEVIEQAEIILKNISNISRRDLMERNSRVLVAKGYIYTVKGNWDLVQKMIEQILSLQKDIGNTPEIVSAHLNMGLLISNVKSRFDLALEYIKKAMLLAEEIEFNHYWIGMCHLSFGIVYGNLGEVDLCLEHEMKSLEIFKEINNKQNVAVMLNNIAASNIMKGNYDLARKYLEESLSLYGTNLGAVALCLFNLTFIALEKENNELVQQYFQRLENIYLEKKEDRRFIAYYRGTKAIMLKKSPRIRDRAKAEEILKELIEEKFGSPILPLIELCDLLLMELSTNHNIEVLDEVKYYITQLLDIAENSHSYLVLGNAYILQAKLALLTLDLKEAQKLLIKAQKIAEKYNLGRLARKISNEHDELLKQMTIWENMDKTDVSLPERLKLTRINQHRENMVKRRAIEVPELSDEEPVHLLIVSEGGTPFFSQSFNEDNSFEDDLFGSFFTAINSFINEKFSKGLDRASFGEYTLLMNSAPPFLMCYIYKGQSYSTQQRLKYLIKKLKGDKELWATFEKYFQLNQEIHLKDIPSLKPLITEIFIERSFQLNM